MEENRENTQSPDNNQLKEEVKKPVPHYAANRRFFFLVTGGDMRKYCFECGGVCGNSNHRPVRRL
jgi:hypothetical protein